MPALDGRYLLSVTVDGKITGSYRFEFKQVPAPQIDLKTR